MQLSNELGDTKQVNDIVLRSSDGTASLTLESLKPGVSGGAEFTFVVSSRGFAARSWYALEAEELAALIADLERMYESLSGTAEIRLHMEEEHVSFFIEPTGRLLVRGVIIHYEEPLHRLEFGFYSDQSCLPEFVRRLSGKQ